MPCSTTMDWSEQSLPSCQRVFGSQRPSTGGSNGFTERFTMAQRPRPFGIAFTRLPPPRSGSPMLAVPPTRRYRPRGLAMSPPNSDVWKYCNTSSSKAVSGRPRRVPWPPKVDTCSCCSGCEHRMIGGDNVLGTERLALRRPKTATSIS
jgi:hypothetical protein